MDYVASVKSVNIPEFDISLFDFLSQTNESAELYELKKAPIVASLDRAFIRQRMRMIIGDINTVAGVLSFALSAYQIYIQENNKPSKEEERPVISVNIQNAGKDNVFNFGTDIKSEKDLLSKMQETLLVTQKEIEIERARATLDSIRNSNEWRRIK